MRKKLPIWLSEWTFQDKKKSIRKAERVIVKGEPNDIINNDMLINRALTKLKGLRKNHTFKPINVELLMQLGYGPDETRQNTTFKETD